ncbi:gp436 family protein [Burkholderia orbicola]|uniref:gp436 family protein n=1 Tax=Burkholderia orbicola TaxID=2978683 RepID=UPI00265083E7|nr:DUF1320 domain-containing protein [Burkholderia orbicola]MDN7533860.1 DUF1320 domain-containing protein [Burkholderia orbicola]
MSYAIVDDMVARFGQLELVQLTDRDNIPPSTMDNVRIQGALDDACAAVDGYVGQVYRLPLRGCLKPLLPGTDPEYAMPPVLVRLTCDIARFYLYDDLSPENEVHRRYQLALKDLDAIASGKTMLSCPWGGSPGELVAADAQQGLDVRHDFGPRAVRDETLRGFG